MKQNLRHTRADMIVRDFANPWHALTRDIQLSVWQDGKLVRKPVLLSIIGMREALLQASDFDEAKVNLICKNVENHGNCSMGAGDGLIYRLAKVLAS